MPKREYARSCKSVSAIVKTAKPMLPLLVIAVLAVSLVSVGVTVAAEEEEFLGEEMCRGISENYTKTLHYTWSGVEHEYARGAGEDFGLAVPKDCYVCHTPLTDCSGCHKGEAMTMEDNCLGCHKKRPGPNYVGKLGGMKKDGPHPDIHYEKGLDCMDCHSLSEIHGDGQIYPNQRLAVQVRCEDCHISPGKVVKGMNVTQYSNKSATHLMHEEKLDCAACHAGWYQTCINCHLEAEKTGKTESSTTEEFRLGVGHEGKVVPFYRMSMTYNNITKTHWTERTPHTITLTNVKNCSFCHEDKEVLCEGCEGKIMIEGGSFIPQETIDKIYGVKMPTATAAPVATAAPAEPAATPTPPGFELIFAVIAIAVVVLLAKRRH